MPLSVSQTIRNRVQMIRDAWVELELCVARVTHMARVIQVVIFT